MLNRVFITGDTHGRVYDRIQTFLDIVEYPDDTALIILGDAGLNFWLNKTDEKQKQKVQDSGIRVYCLHGNHEARPQRLDGIVEWYDEDIGGVVYLEKDFPNIRYFIDGHAYNIKGYKVLTIGGAYSVDKWYRLLTKNLTGKEDYDTLAKAGWFADEQLSNADRNRIQYLNEGKDFDFVLTHTCPFEWMPTDLFLSQVDQSTVDNSTELWMQGLKDTFNWNIWLFGHFHDDRLVRPKVEMYYHDVEEIDTIWNRWFGKETIKDEWWLKKDPCYYMN